MGLLLVLPLRVRVDPGLMTMKGTPHASKNQTWNLTVKCSLASYLEPPCRGHSKVGDHSRGWHEGFLFNSFQGVGEGATPFPWLLHFTLDPCLIMLSVKQGGTNYNFWVFSMTWPGIEPLSPGPLANTLLIRSIARYNQRKLCPYR